MGHYHCRRYSLWRRNVARRQVPGGKHPIIEGYEEISRAEERRLRKMTTRQACRELEGLLRLRGASRWIK